MKSMNTASLCRLIYLFIPCILHLVKPTENEGKLKTEMHSGNNHFHFSVQSCVSCAFDMRLIISLV